MLPFGVTIPATVPQGSEFPEGLMNNPVLRVALWIAYCRAVRLTKPQKTILFQRKQLQVAGVEFPGVYFMNSYLLK